MGVYGGGIGATVVPITPKMRALKLDDAVIAAQMATVLVMQNKVLNKLRIPAPPKVPTTYRRGSSPESNVNSKWMIRDVRGISTDIYNPVSYARFVYGDNHGQGQMSYHKATGWPNMYALFLRSRTEIVNAAREAFSLEVKRIIASA